MDGVNDDVLDPESILCMPAVFVFGLDPLRYKLAQGSVEQLVGVTIDRVEEDGKRFRPDGSWTTDFVLLPLTLPPYETAPDWTLND